MAAPGRWTRAAWSYLAGAALWGALLFACSHLGLLPLRSRPLLVLLTTLAIAGAGGAVHLHRRTRGSAAARAVPAAGGERDPLRPLVVTVAIVVGLGIFVAASGTGVVDGDGRMTWRALARFMAAAGAVDSPVLRDGECAVSHPRYPPLLPLLQLTALDAAADDDRAVKPVYVAFWVALSLVTWDGARRLAGAGAAALVTLLLCGLAFPCSRVDGGATGAYSDLPLGALVGGAAILLLDERSGLRGAAVAAPLLAGAVLAKNEGVVLAAAVLLGAVVARLGRRALLRELSRLAPAVAAVLVALPLLAHWRSAIPDRWDEHYATALTLPRLIAGAARLPVIVGAAKRETLDLESWGVCWPLLLVLVGWAVVATPLRRDRRFLGLMALVGIALAGYVVAYLVSPWRPQDLVPSTWSRFLIQLLVPALLLGAMACKELLAAASGPFRAAAAPTRAGDGDGGGAEEPAP